MSQQLKMEERIHQLEGEVHHMRRVGVVVGCVIALIFMMGAAASVTTINGDLMVTGKLSVAGSDIQERVRDLDRVSPPIGAILPFFGDPVKLQDTGWVVANKANAAVHKGLVPDLENRFLLGVGSEPVGTAGGVEAYGPEALSGKVEMSKDRKRRDGNGFQGEGDECMMWNIAMTIDPLKARDNRPPYLRVYYIVRVK